MTENQIALRADSLLALRQAAQAGLGLAALPCYLGDTSDLVCVRGGWEAFDALPMVPEVHAAVVAARRYDEATAELNELGFFAAGLVLHGPDGHDHLRLQLIDCEEIELEEIVCDSSFAEALRQRVLQDKARIGG